MLKTTKIITALFFITISAVIYAQEPCAKCKENPESCKLIQTGKCDDCGGEEKTIEKKITVISADENRGFLGVVTKEEKGKLLVTEVVPNSPAEKSGIRKNDMILEVNGASVKTRDELIAMLQKTKANETVQFKIKSLNKEKMLKIVLGEMPKSEVKLKAHCGKCPEANMPIIKDVEKEFVVMPPQETPRGFIGVVIAPQKGKLAIQSIVPNSPAQKAGLKQSDIIAELNGIKVSTPSELIEVLNGTKPKDIVRLKIISKGIEKLIDIELGSVSTF